MSDQNMTVAEFFAGIGLSCGIGGFRVVTNRASLAHGVDPICVFLSEINLDYQTAYGANFDASDWEHQSR